MSDSPVLNFAAASHSKLVILAVVEFLHKRSFSYLYPYRTEENPSSAWESYYSKRRAGVGMKRLELSASCKMQTALIETESTITCPRHTRRTQDT